ncbi:metabolite traffic protein EboE [Dactylosporangium fulvum]|uniref:Metabolite traffic protein EboE n=1 Tax=Dactylosporangium fulvum TaxID=53359 RepID=A0ABY5W3Z6_9ACTN|nr:metabolite traffic protein EboE [Dactylosporangium fulvum]UWP84647.1 metabolite traffic protein EboE [Dactylosporangium fulvum]
MRLRHPDGQVVHLAYGTNVHPAEDVAGIIGQLDTYAARMRDRLGADVLGLGLWLGVDVATELAGDPALRRRLRRELDVRGLEVVTLNGFPYRAFHAPVVKRKVYLPDWAEPARLRYTLDLARILVDLLPDDAARGSISTLPLGWREPWDSAHVARVCRALDALAGGLAGLEALTGRTIRVAFEPEPGCVIENTMQATVHLSTVDPTWLGVCVDLAHLACAWEDPVAAVQRLARAGLPVVKIQVSAALEVADPAADAAVLAHYVEPKFMHQTRSAGCRASFDDLDEALASGADGPWRVHYHVPLHAEPEPPLRATTGVLRAGLGALVGGPVAVCDHLEVETYTWGVLPHSQRPDSPEALADGMAAELAYARDTLQDLGLKTLESR